MKKKLLILGATAETIPLVKKAEQMGIDTFVVDNKMDSPAKEFSSHPLNCDCFDIEELLRIIKAESIDGIMLGCADILVPVYEELCRKAGKYCYLNKAIVHCFSNKFGLKEMLRKHNLPVIPEYSYEEIHDKEFNSWPVFVKPVDNNSGKGTSRVSDLDQFEPAYQKALTFSKSKQVLIEQDMTGQNDFACLYVISDGKAVLSITSDRFTITESDEFGQLTSVLIMPSPYTDLFIETVNTKLVEIFNELNFSNGIFLCQAFIKDNNIILYDPAVRFTGGQEHYLLQKFFNVDILSAFIQFALTGEMPESLSKECSLEKIQGFTSNIRIIAKCGIIGKIEGLEQVQSLPFVLQVTQKHFTGDEIKAQGTLDQNVAQIQIYSMSKKDLFCNIKSIFNLVKVLDNNGHDMLVRDERFADGNNQIDPKN